MSVEVFFDTNVLVYFFDQNDPKSKIADELIVRGGKISVQSLNEFVNVCRRKIRMDWDDIHSALADLAVACEPPIPLRHFHHVRALSIAEQYGYSIYDSLILATAISAKCSILYSEDMQHGQTIEGLTILNPFRIS